MFPVPLKAASFGQYTAREINCSRGCADWDEHNLHLLEEKAAINIRLADNIGAALVVPCGRDAKLIADALADYLNFEINEEIRQQKQPALVPASMPPSSYGPLSSAYIEAELIRITEVLQTREAQHEKVTDALSRMPEDMRAIMEAGALNLLESEIQGLKEQLSFLQRRMESEQI